TPPPPPLLPRTTPSSPPPPTTPPDNHKDNAVRKISAGKHLFGKYEGTQQTRAHCSISKHPNIGKPENAFDYGLIHLADPFLFNEHVNAISLAPAGGACLHDWGSP
ncbi:unnamed protein product, partial [Allacma fusca]